MAVEWKVKPSKMKWHQKVFIFIISVFSTQFKLSEEANFAIPNHV